MLLPGPFSIYIPPSCPQPGPQHSLPNLSTRGRGQLSAAPAPASPVGGAAALAETLSHLFLARLFQSLGWTLGFPGLFFSTPTLGHWGWGWGYGTKPPRGGRGPCQRGGYSCPGGEGGSSNGGSLAPLLRRPPVPRLRSPEPRTFRPCRGERWQAVGLARRNRSRKDSLASHVY